MRQKCQNHVEAVVEASALPKGTQETYPLGPDIVLEIKRDVKCLYVNERDLKH